MSLIILLKMCAFIVHILALNREEPTENIFGKVIQEIISTYFMEYRCIVTITEDTREILHYIPSGIQRFHFKIGGPNSTVEEIEENDTLDTAEVNEGTRTLERLLVKALDSGCQGFIIQVKNARSLVYSFARATRRCVPRFVKRYVFLQVAPAFDIQDIFSMKEIKFMPNLIVVRYSKEWIINSQTSKFASYIQKNEAEDLIVFSNESKPMKEQHKTKTILFGLLKSQWYYSLTNTVSENHNTLEEKYEVNALIEIVTHRFVGNENSGDEILLDVWGKNGGKYEFLYKNNLFPDKSRNLEGKQLQLIAFTWAQYVIVDETTVPPTQDGIEILLIAEFSRKFNATWKLKLDEINLWGHIYDNGSGIGLIGNVVTDRADFAFAALYVWHSTFQWLDFTRTYGRGAVICLAPKPKMIPKWLSPFLPFTILMWGGMFISLLLIAVTLNILARASHSLLGATGLDHYYSVLNSIILTLGMFLEQSPPDNADAKDPDHSPIRRLVATILVFSLLISTAYSSGLSSVLTLPRFEPAIETPEDLADRDIIWAGNHMAWVWSIWESEEPVLKTLTTNYRVLEEDDIISLASQGKISFPFEKLSAGNYAIGLRLTEDTIQALRIMKEPLYWSHIVMLSRKSSPYAEHMNTLISRLNAAGIPLYWEGYLTRKYFSSRMQIAIEKSVDLVSDDGPIILLIEHLEGVFIILGFGLSLSLIVFIAELVQNKFKNRNTRGFQKVSTLRILQ